MWEGLFKSCLVQEERYLLEVYKYIELNPVLVEMVADPEEYCWSSYQINGLGKVSDLCTPHKEHLSLGKYPDERQKNYRELFVQNINGELLEEIEVLTDRRLKSIKERAACRVAEGESLILLCPLLMIETWEKLLFGLRLLWQSLKAIQNMPIDNQAFELA